MKIKAIAVKDFRAIRTVEVSPGDAAVVCVGGRNRQGKSSLLNAIEVAVGGKKFAPPRPVRDGQKAAELLVELDDGLVVRRRITAAGAWTIEVRDAEGRRSSPQALLDRLIGARFLDPLAFLREPPKAQRELVLRVARVPIDLDDNLRRRRDAYDERRDVARDLKRRRAEAEAIGPARELASLPDVAEARRRVTELRIARDQEAAQRERIIQLRTRRDELANHIESLRAQIADLISEEESIARELSGAEFAAGVGNFDATALAEMEDLITSAAVARSRQATDVAHNDRVAAVGREVTDLDRKNDELTRRIEELDIARRDAMAAADLPVAGLEVTDDGLEFRGAPLEQASDAERLQLALAVAAAGAGELRDIWVRDGALLDDESLAAVAAFAAERGIRIWVERVGDQDDGALVIEGGQVRGP